MKGNQSIKQFLPWLAVALALFAATTWWFLPAGPRGQNAAPRSLPLDDCYIHLDYSRALLEEHCPCFNQGVPEAGMTSPLWVMLLAVMLFWGDLLGFGPAASAQILSALFGLCSALLAGLIAGQRQDGDFEFLGASLVSVIILIAPFFNFSRLAGMEVTLSAFLILASIYFWSLRMPLLLGSALALSALARPENLLLIGLLILSWGLRAAAKKEKPATLFKVILPPVILVGAWFAFDWSVSGRPLPNTYYAKTVPLSLPHTRNLLNIISESGFGLGRSRLVPALIFYLAGACYLLRRRREMWPVLVYPWLFIYGVYITRELPDFRSYYNNRYFQPVIPCLLIPLGMGLVSSGRFFYSLWKAKKWHTRTAAAAGFGVSALLFLMIVHNWSAFLERQKKLLADNCSNIYEIHVRAGEWISRNLPEDAVVAAYDVGAIRYYGNRQILDLAGLNTHQVLDDPSYIYEQKPSHFFLPASREEREIIEQGNKEWVKYRLPGDKWVELRPVFWVEAKKYTVTSRHPNLQILYEARYINASN